MPGMKVVWLKGNRVITARKGKNQGPVVEQVVTKHYVPKASQ